MKSLLKDAIILFVLYFALTTLIGCAKEKDIPIVWWVSCRSDVQGPIDRVGIQDGDYFYTDKFESELYGCLPTPYHFAQPEMFRVIYSVHLHGLKAGDVIAYSARAELTNDLYTSDVMFAWYMSLASTHTETKGKEISRPHGYNCTPASHHCMVSEMGFYKLDKDYDNIYLNFVIYTAGAAMYDANMVIEQHYGGLEGYIIRSNP